MNLPFFKEKTPRILWSLTLLLFGSRVFAQQQNFSYNEYADNLTPLNAAYSAIDKSGSVNLLGRKQWVGIQGAPASELFSFNAPIPSIDASAGVYVINDQIAIEHLIETDAFFAKAIQLISNNFLAVSLNIGFRSYTANYSTIDSADPTFKNDIRETKPNMGFGVMFFSDKYYVGVSVPELTIRGLGTASVLQADYLKNHYYFAGAYLADLAEDIKFKPATLISYVNGSPVTADISGTIYLADELGLGVNYNTGKQMAGMFSVNVNTFKIGYSYQFNVSSTNLGTYNTATHEVSLSYRFGTNLAHKLL